MPHLWNRTLLSSSTQDNRFEKCDNPRFEDGGCFLLKEHCLRADAVDGI